MRFERMDRENDGVNENGAVEVKDRKCVREVKK